MVGVLVVVAVLLVVVLVLLCRALSLWGSAGGPAPRGRAAAGVRAARTFSGGSEAVERSVHSTTRVVGR